MGLRQLRFHNCTPEVSQTCPVAPVSSLPIAWLILEGGRTPGARQSRRQNLAPGLSPSTPLCWVVPSLGKVLQWHRLVPGTLGNMEVVLSGRGKAGHGGETPQQVGYRGTQDLPTAPCGLQGRYPGLTGLLSCSRC